MNTKTKRLTKEQQKHIATRKDADEYADLIVRVYNTDWLTAFRAVVGKEIQQYEDLKSGYVKHAEVPLV